MGFVTVGVLSWAIIEEKANGRVRAAGSCWFTDGSAGLVSCDNVFEKPRAFRCIAGAEAMSPRLFSVPACASSQIVFGGVMKEERLARSVLCSGIHFSNRRNRSRRFLLTVLAQSISCESTQSYCGCCFTEHSMMGRRTWQVFGRSTSVTRHCLYDG